MIGLREGASQLRAERKAFKLSSSRGAWRWREGGEGRTGRRTRELERGREMERKKGGYGRWGLRMEKKGGKKGFENQRNAWRREKSRKAEKSKEKKRNWEKKNGAELKN